MPAPGPSGSSGGHDELSAAVAALAADNASLRAQLTQRHLIDLATGILLTQLEASPAEAAEHLVRLAEATGLSSEDLAADIVNGVVGTIAVASPAASSGDDGRNDGTAVAEARRTRRVASAAEADHSVGRGGHPAGGRAASTRRRESVAVAPDGVRLFPPRRTRRRERHGSGAVAVDPTGGPRAVSPGCRGRLPAVVGLGGAPGSVLPGAPEAARALLPLRLKGATVGLALVVWPGPADLDDSLRRALTDLIDVAARVLNATETAPSPRRCSTTCSTPWPIRQ